MAKPTTLPAAHVATSNPRRPESTCFSLLIQTPQSVKMRIFFMSGNSKNPLTDRAFYRPALRLNLHGTAKQAPINYCDF
ncbi:hypothetical protein GJA_5077 [Janthinobacterium agaricidamnosum NBRC 102515 = DSM 9628]|uniref:Uncharacterized protein n=1 Tax=Janthinobacterium agaricidamnosum NBRC 102515 = DSM 9628 TaxID=1349767 RepID=W0VCN6_9BURK|nr:hypothetical protein GJA_5077 [Janthinobacterium agaricidamnosum NBRC 102515 = DSM 9628]